MEIKVKELGKNYNDCQALQAATCTLNSGEIIGLVGPNGAGKTTLLKVIAGLLDYSEGRVTYNHVAQTEVSYIPERPDLFPLLTLQEHFKFMAIAAGLRSWQAKADKLLERFQLSEKRDTFGHELSKGMKQKAMLSLSLLNKPRVVLFDEPFSGLDPQSGRELKTIISDLKDEDRIIVVSSHNLNAIYQLSDRVLFLRSGEVLRDQKIDSIFAELEEKNYVALEELFLEVMESETD